MRDDDIQDIDDRVRPAIARRKDESAALHGSQRVAGFEEVRNWPQASVESRECADPDVRGLRIGPGHLRKACGNTGERSARKPLTAGYRQARTCSAPDHHAFGRAPHNAQR